MSALPDTVPGMRILHTSDWHLGRTLHGVDLLAHQGAYLEHLVDVVRSERVDAVLVAGDVYDRAIPPVEAVALLADALARLSETAAVVVTPGNHDSAVRLGFGAALMRPGVHLRARVADVGRPVVLADAHGPVHVHALPYLDPDGVRRELADDGAGPDGQLARSHEAVVAAAMRRVRASMADAQRGSGAPVRSVVMAHAFVVGGAASESERDIRVGGVDAVPAALLGGVDYVALGHLHGPQAVAAPGAVARYSGSPLAYSFSERHHTKSSVLVELGADVGRSGAGAVRTELVAAPVPRRLAEVVGTLEELLGPSGEPHLDDWLRVVVTDQARPAELYARVKGRFPHALVVEHRPPVAGLVGRAPAVTAASDPLAVAEQFVAHVTGAPPSHEERAVLRHAYEQVLAADRSA